MWPWWWSRTKLQRSYYFFLEIRTWRIMHSASSYLSFPWWTWRFMPSQRWLRRWWQWWWWWWWVQSSNSVTTPWWRIRKMEHLQRFIISLCFPSGELVIVGPALILKFRMRWVFFFVDQLSWLNSLISSFICLFFFVHLCFGSILSALCICKVCKFGLYQFQILKSRGEPVGAGILLLWSG